MARSAAALCLAALLLCSGALMAAAADAEQAGDTSAVGSGEAAAVAEGAASATPQQRPPFIVLRHQDSWLLEGLAVAFLLTFLVNMLIGRRRNERLALAWTAEVRWDQAFWEVCCLLTAATTCLFADSVVQASDARMCSLGRRTSAAAGCARRRAGPQLCSAGPGGYGGEALVPANDAAEHSVHTS